MSIYVIQDDNRAKVMFVSTSYGEHGEETTNASLRSLIFTGGCWHAFLPNDQLEQLFGMYSRTGNSMRQKKLPGNHVKEFPANLMKLAEEY